MSEAPHLLVDEQGGILIATLNRPDKLNALSAETMQLFEEALMRFRDTPELKVLLVRATGRYFCSGADLKQGSEEDRKPLKSARAIRERHRLKLNGMQRIYDEMEHIEKPIVVAHQGACVGGGLELSLSCDFRLAARSASYAFPEGLFGVLPASGGVSPKEHPKDVPAGLSAAVVAPRFSVVGHDAPLDDFDELEDEI